LTARPAQHFRHAFKAMGSPCELQLFSADETRAQRAIAAVVADVERLEQLYSRYRDSSLLSSINRVAAHGGSIAVDDETAGLFNYATTCFAESDGLFDITSGVLRKAWDFKSGRLPDPVAVERLLAQVGWDKVSWDPPVIGFPVAGMELDLGGVVKEYAADRAASLCRDRGVHSGMVNLGGDIAIVGPRPDGDTWRIGLQHPRSRENLMGTLQLHAGGLASSGDYERCLVIDGVRYGHILNPRTGWPVRYMASVSVVADLCVVAGSACTIAMLKDDAGPAWLEQLGLNHVWVNVNGEVGGSVECQSLASPER
jgi:thiamine biosynthesis lipoprotein